MSIQDSNSSSNKPMMIVGAIIILLLLGGLIYFASQNSKLKKSNENIKTELSDKQMLADDLQQEIDAAKTELDNMKTDNAELNALIEEQKAELDNQKVEIEKLIRNGASLERARREIKQLKSKTEEYVNEITALKAQNEELTESNTMLVQTVSEKTARNEELEMEKSDLTTQKTQLEEERSYLAAKVNRASVVNAGNIEVTGQMVKEGGKVKEKDKASKVNRFRICFDASENPVTEKGTERFYIRVLDPRGETLAVESMGSGVTKLQNGNQQIRYTKSEDISYDNKTSQVCTYWNDPNGFESGKYEVEVYNKGYLSGKASYTLK